MSNGGPLTASSPGELLVITDSKVNETVDSVISLESPSIEEIRFDPNSVHSKLDRNQSESEGRSSEKNDSWQYGHRHPVILAESPAVSVIRRPSTLSGVCMPVGAFRGRRLVSVPEDADSLYETLIFHSTNAMDSVVSTADGNAEEKLPTINDDEMARSIEKRNTLGSAEGDSVYATGQHNGHCSELLDENTRLQSQIEVLSTSAATFMKERVELQSRLAHLEARNRAFDLSLQSVIGARDEAVTELSKYKSQSRPNEVRLHQLEWELQSKAQECALKEGKLDKAQQQKEEFRRKACELEVERDEQDGVIGALKNKISSIQVQLEEVRHEKMRAASSDSPSRSAVNSLTAERDSLAEQLLKMKKEQLQLRTDLQRLVDERLEDRLKMDSMRKENAVLSQRVADVQHTAIREKTNFLKQLEKVETEQRQREVEFLRQSVQQVGSQKSNGSKVLSAGEWKRISELIARTDVLEVELTVARNESQDLRETLLTAEHERKEYAQRIVVADKSLEERDSTIEFLTGRLESANIRMKEILDRQTSYDEREGNIKLLLLEMNELRSSKSSVMLQKDEITAELRKARENLSAVQQQNEDIRMEVIKLKSELGTASLELSSVNARLLETAEEKKMLNNVNGMLLQERDRDQLKLSAFSEQAAVMEHLQKDLGLAREQENIWKQHALAWQGYSEHLSVKPAVRDCENQTDVDTVTNEMLSRNIAVLESKVKEKEDAEASFHAAVREHMNRSVFLDSQLHKAKEETRLLTDRVAHLDTELLSTRTVLEEKSLFVTEGLDSVAALQDENRHLTIELQSQQKVREALLAEVQSLRSQFDFLTAEYNDSRQRSDQLSVSLNAMIQENEEQQKNVHNRETENLQSQLVSMTELNGQLQEHLEKLEQVKDEPDQLHNSTGSASLLKEKIKSMEFECYALQAQIETLSGNIEISVRERDEQWRAFYDNQQQIMDQRLAVLTEENARLSLEIQRLDQVAVAISSQAISPTPDSDSFAGNEHSTLLAEKVTLEGELEVMREKVVYLESELAHLRSLPVGLSASTAQVLADQKNETIALLEQRVHEMIVAERKRTEECSTLSTANKLLRDRLQEVEQYVRDLDAKRQTDDQKVLETIQQQSSMADQLQLLREKYQQCENERINLAHQISTMASQLPSVVQSYSSDNMSVISKLEHHIETLEAQKQSLQMDVLNLSTATSELQEKYHHLQQSIVVQETQSDPVSEATSSSLLPVTEAIPKGRPDLKKRIAKLRKHTDSKKEQLEQNSPVTAAATVWEDIGSNSSRTALETDVSVMPSPAVTDKETAQISPAMIRLEEEKSELHLRIQMLENALQKSRDEAAVVSASFALLQEQFSQLQSEDRPVINNSVTSSPVSFATEDSIAHEQPRITKGSRTKVDLKQRISKLRDAKKAVPVIDPNISNTFRTEVDQYVSVPDLASTDRTGAAEQTTTETDARQWEYGTTMESLAREKQHLEAQLYELWERNTVLEKEVASLDNAARERTADLERDLLDAREHYAKMESEFLALQAEHEKYAAEVTADLSCRDEQWNQFIADQKSHYEDAYLKLDATLSEQIVKLQIENQSLKDEAGSALEERNSENSLQDSLRAEFDERLRSLESERGDFVAKIEQMQQIIDAHQKYLVPVTSGGNESGATTTEVEFLEHEVSKLQVRNAVLEEQLEILKAQSTVQENNALLAQQHLALGWESAYGDLQHRNCSLSDQLAALQSENQALKEQVALKLETRTAEKTLFEERSVRQEQRMHSLESERVNWRVDAETMQQAVDTQLKYTTLAAGTNQGLAAEIELLNSKLSNLQEQNSLLTGEITNLRIQADLHEKSTSDVQHHLTQGWENAYNDLLQLHCNMSEQVENLHLENQMLKDRLVSEREGDKALFAGQLAELQEQLSVLETERTKLLGDLEIMRQIIDTQQSYTVSAVGITNASLSEVEQLKHNLLEIHERNDVLNGEVKGLRAEMKLQEQNAALTQQRWESFVEENSRLNEQRLTDQTELVKCYKDELIRVKSEYDLERNGFEEAMASLGKRCVELEEERNRFTATHEETIADINATVQQHDVKWKAFLQIQTERLETENRTLSEELASANSKLETLAALKERCAALETSFATARESETGLQAKLLICEAELTEIKKTYAEQIDVINHSIAQHDQAYKECITQQTNFFEQEKNRLEAEVLQLQQYVATLTQRSQPGTVDSSVVSDAQSDKVTDQTEHLRAEDERLTKEVNDLSECLSTATVRVGSPVQREDGFPALQGRLPREPVRSRSPSAEPLPTVQSKFAVQFDTSPSVFDEILLQTNSTADMLQQQPKSTASSADTVRKQEEDFEKMSQQLSESGQRIFQLEEQLRGYMDHESRFQNLSQRVFQLQMELDEKTSEIVYAYQEKADVERKLLAVETELTWLQEKDQRRTSRDTITTMNVAQLSDTLQEMEEKLTSLNTEKAQLEESLREKESTTAFQLVDLSNQLVAVKAEYEAQMPKFQQEWERYLSERTSSLEAENHWLKAKLADVVENVQDSGSQSDAVVQTEPVDVVSPTGHDMWSSFSVSTESPANVTSEVKSEQHHHESSSSFVPISEYAQTMDIFERTIEELTKLPPAACTTCDQLAEQLKATENQLESLSAEIEKLHKAAVMQPPLNFSTDGLSKENESLREKLRNYEELLSTNGVAEIDTKIRTEDFDDVIGLKEDRMRLQVELLAVQEEMEKLRSLSQHAEYSKNMQNDKRHDVEIQTEISGFATVESDASSTELRNALQNWIDFAGQLQSQCSEYRAHTANFQEQSAEHAAVTESKVSEMGSNGDFSGYLDLVLERLRVAEVEREEFVSQMLRVGTVRRGEAEPQTDAKGHEATIKQLELKIAAAEEEIVRSRVVFEEIVSGWVSSYQAAQEQLSTLRRETDKQCDSDAILDRNQLLTLEVQKAHGKNLALEQLNTTLQQQLLLMENQLTDKESLILTAKQELEDARLHLRILKTAVELEKEGLIAQVEFLEGEIHNKDEQIKETRDLSAEVQHSAETNRQIIVDLEHQLEIRDKRIEEKQNKVQGMRGEIKRLRDELNTLRSSYEEADQKRKTMEVEYTGVRIQNTNLEQEIKILSEEVERRQVLHDAFRNRVGHEASILDEEIQGLRDHLQTREAEFRELEQLFIELRQDKSDLEKRLRSEKRRNRNNSHSNNSESDSRSGKIAPNGETPPKNQYQKLLSLVEGYESPKSSSTLKSCMSNLKSEIDDLKAQMDLHIQVVKSKSDSLL